MNKNKICFFIPFYPVVKGGAEYQARILANELRTRGNAEVFFISETAGAETVGELDGFKVYQVSVTSGLLHRITLYRDFMKKVNAILLMEQPDVIYQRILNTYSFWLMRIAESNRTPLVLHIADNYSLEFSSGLRGWLKKWLTCDVFSRGPNIICQSDFQAVRVRELGYAPALIMPNVHPIIELTQTEKDKRKILWVGNARPVKQLELFLELAEKAKGTDLQFHVVGGLPETEYGRNLKSQMSRMKSVFYHGQKENRFINQALEGAGLLVNTSVSEGFPNTFIQSWMCGTPVVSLNSDPLGLIEKYGIGYNCQGNADILFEAVTSLLNDPYYEDLAAQAISVSRKYFAADRNMKDFVKVLNKVLNGDN